MAHQAHQYVLDGETQLKDAGLVAADAAAQVGGVDTYVDLGSANAYAKFDVVIDWTACEVATGDEKYEIQIQGADDTGFTTNKTILARQAFGDSSVTGQSVDTPAFGRAVIRADNVVQLAATSFASSRYIRLYTDVSGTIATGMNFSAWLVPSK